MNSSLRFVIDSCNVSILLAVASSLNVVRSSLDDILPVVSPFGDIRPVVSSGKEIVEVMSEIKS
jgi:hypothetical protein